MNITFKTFASLTALTCVMLLFCLNCGDLGTPSGYFYAVSVVGLLFGAIFPKIGFGFLLLIVPVFGNRPGMPQELLLTCLVSAFALPICLRQAMATKASTLSSEVGEEDFFSFRTPFLYFLYCIACCLSLIALPWRHMLADLYAALPKSSDFVLIAHYFDSELLRGEYSGWHSVKTVAFTLAVFQIALFGYQQARQDKRFVMYVSLAALSGLLICVTVGLVDYYGITNLRSLRGLDPIVNPGDVQFRLQSFFGHSGWFAEYVTLSIPTVIAVLFLPLSRWIKITAIVTILLAGEFVLILTFQRGGWVSYPITLLVTWSAIYMLGSSDAASGKKSFGKLFKTVAPKILISLPITVICSVSFILLLRHFHALPEVGGISVDSYVNRFEDITKASDRTQFMQAGYMLGSTSPVIGLGSESFAFWFRELFKIPSGKFYGTFDLPLFGSAHNVYAQTFCGKGLLGVITLVLLMLNLLVLSVKALANQTGQAALEESRVSSLAAGMLLATTSSFLIYGVVQEIFYIASLEVLLFCLLLTFAARIDLRLNARTRTIATAILIIAVLMHILFIKVPPTSADNQRTVGCFAVEGDGSRWCGPRSTFVADKDGEVRIYFGNAFRRLLPATLVVSKNGQRFAEWDFNPTKNSTSSILVKAGDTLEFRTQAYFVSLFRHESNDRRVLAFKLLE